ncbi:hypothetical protein [Kocuria sp. HSID16901]|uniref:hypothetical protein n=1 Tax=Kocuria sp. HSID16901 TaxID=2419505 RepID=UPI000A579D73|nr:hypothetical protein [Kocuria sp. HSID16901]RUQ22521.1 hypothetical protein D8M21_03560 [Kocuria sp. HSID16901]
MTTSCHGWVGEASEAPDPSCIDRELESRAVFGSWSRRKPGEKRDVQGAGEILEMLSGTRRTPSVLITGSKGKGEAATTAAAHLSNAGLRVGLVSSPGIISNLDRFSIDGAVVGAGTYNRWLRRLAGAVESQRERLRGYLAPTGLFTVMGHAMMTAAGVDVVVHEAGMGGAHDEISLLDRWCVGFTSIFAEHLDVFGPTLAHVAQEKFGLIRPNDVVWSVPQSQGPRRVLHDLAERRNAQVQIVAAGDFRTQNRALGEALADTACRAVGVSPSTEPVVVSRPGRGEMRVDASGARYIVDASIDSEGLRRTFLSALEAWGAVDQILWSVPATKNVVGMADWLDAQAIPHYFVPLPGGHLDYRLPQKLQERLRIIPRDRVMDAVTDRTVITGTISFGSSILRETGVTLERLYGPVRIGTRDSTDQGVYG